MSQILNTLSFIRITLIVAVLCTSFSLHADWTNLTGAEAVAHLQSMRINSLVYQPLGNRPVDGGFISIMQANLKNLEKVFISTELE